MGAALSDPGDTANLAKRLAQRFTVINYDRCGRGQSADTRPYAVEREVEDIEALIDAAAGSVHMFGSSSGAALALEAGSKLEGMGIPAVFVTLMHLLMPGWSKRAGMAHTLPHDFAVMAGTQAGRPLPAGRWASTEAPALVVVGSKSDAFFHSGAKALSNVLPHAQYRTLEGQDHGAVLMAPNAIATAVEESSLASNCVVQQSPESHALNSYIVS